jgi:hypothetical protein
MKRVTPSIVPISIAALLLLFVAVMAGGAHALDVRPIEEQVTVATMGADVVTNQLGTFEDPLAPDAGEAGRNQNIPTDGLPLCRLVPLAPGIDPVTRTDRRTDAGPAWLELLPTLCKLPQTTHGTTIITNREVAIVNDN